GERFDPNQHQSMFETETLDFEPGTVMQVLRTGYTIHGRLLRPAMVGVAKMPAEPKS
ncbi:MAG: nucleotide exchange factor GrpE, partial [Rhodospirillaceae bacterium]|nr:nucleotide exchange factor GrpE [Rhodospirillaceae bacterium]